jgi:hypothetical protein
VADPVLAWFPAPGEVPSVGLTSVFPAAGKLDVEDADEAGAAGLELPEAGADVVTLGLAVLAGLELGVAQGEAAVFPGFLLPVALAFAVAVAEAVAPAVLVALPLAVALAVAVAVLVAEAVPVAEALPPSLGLAVVPPPAGLLLALPLGGVVCEAAGVASGVCDLADLAALADLDARAGEVAVAQAVARALRWPADVLAGPAPPLAEPAALPDPARLGALWLGLAEEIPTADPSWTKASRSGGSARTTPMAKTAQAPARIGLSRPSRQSRCRGRGRGLAPRADSSPARPPFPRPASPARKPRDTPKRPVARAGPDRTRARIRSSPSGRGSTWSAAACSVRRRYSPKSMGSGPCGGMPSNPDLVITPAPRPSAGRSCRGRCGS